MADPTDPWSVNDAAGALACAKCGGDVRGPGCQGRYWEWAAGQSPKHVDVTWPFMVFGLLVLVAVGVWLTERRG